MQGHASREVAYRRPIPWSISQDEQPVVHIRTDGPLLQDRHDICLPLGNKRDNLSSDLRHLLFVPEQLLLPIIMHHNDLLVSIGLVCSTDFPVAQTRLLDLVCVDSHLLAREP